LPADVSSEGIVIVSGVTAKKTDAPFLLAFSAPGAPAKLQESGGCALPRRGFGSSGPSAWLGALVALLAARRSRAKPLPR
jgi:hypothetical protein